MSEPRVTIGLPVFNGEQYLDETLHSLRAQDVEDLEILVSDNASTDGTVDIVQAHTAEDSRIRLVRNPTNRGAAANYNRLVHDARGEYFKWAGYDDLLDPAYVRRCVAELDQHSDAVLAFPSTAIINEAGGHVADHDDKLDLRSDESWRRVAQFAKRVSLCNACFGIMRRDTMLTTGLIRPHVSSDITFLAEMAARGMFVQLPDRLFYRRVHAGSSRQGHTTMAEVARWFDTSATKGPLAPRARLFVETMRALAGGPAPRVDRCASVAAFTGVYGARRMKIRAGRARAYVAGGSPRKPEFIHQIEGAEKSPQLVTQQEAVGAQDGHGR